MSVYIWTVWALLGTLALYSVCLISNTCYIGLFAGLEGWHERDWNYTSIVWSVTRLVGRDIYIYIPFVPMGLCWRVDLSQGVGEKRVELHHSAKSNNKPNCLFVYTLRFGWNITSRQPSLCSHSLCMNCTSIVFWGFMGASACLNWATQMFPS